MSFRATVREVLSKQGVDCSLDDLEGFNDSVLVKWTGLPHPKDMKGLTIMFEGETSPYARMDAKGLKVSLRSMKNPDSVVINSNKICVSLEFGLDAPCVVWLFSKHNFTRKSLAVAISMQYRKIFDDRKRYKVWCAKLSYIHLYAIYFDFVKDMYRLDVDLQN
jgi:hypothetical protein